MATIGHVAAGIALGRGAGRKDVLAIALLIASAVSPDIDFLLQVEHRGPTHSVAFALIVGAIMYLAARLVGIPRPAQLGALAVVAVGSHIILDLLTAHDAVAVAWPVSNRELAFAWTPLPAAPANRSIFTMNGLLLLALELAWSMAMIAVAEHLRSSAAGSSKDQDR